ncbi:hypothetical protein [Solwaraspora sp. WMMA2101]|uniref:hypothetical protein n=1 Tax=Solwaraspora sp. WMMA2101 TaxID=3404124 RepID=UPI003B9481BB
MTAGWGPEPPLVGSWTLAEKLALRPWWDTLTVMLLLDTLPVTVAGLAGLSPYTVRSASSRVSARRQRQSALVVMRVPLALRKGSGSRAEEPGPVPGTGQSAPSSSTVEATSRPGVAAASAEAEPTLTTVAAAAIVSAAADSMTTVGRTFDRPELMLTGLSF